jgi:hypothetical protein
MPAMIKRTRGSSTVPRICSTITAVSDGPGPPRHPGFYGQTERQNREHRQWLDQLDVIDQDELDRMLHALNTLWRRPTLGFQTAEEAWKMRPTIREDRSILSEEVSERAGRLAPS